MTMNTYSAPDSHFKGGRCDMAVIRVAHQGTQGDRGVVAEKSD